MSQLMERFEHGFKNLDIQSAAMDSSMAAMTTLKAAREPIDQLMQHAADDVCRRQS